MRDMDREKTKPSLPRCPVSGSTLALRGGRASVFLGAKAPSIARSAGEQPTKGRFVLAGHFLLTGPWPGTASAPPRSPPRRGRALGRARRPQFDTHNRFDPSKSVQAKLPAADGAFSLQVLGRARNDSLGLRLNRQFQCCVGVPQWPRRQLERRTRKGMRYLKLLILVLASALISPAFAQTCCPAGCAPDANRCVTTGPLWTTCIPLACAGISRRPSAESAGPTREHRTAVLARPVRTARTYVAPRQIPPQCPLMNPTRAQVDEATNQCVNALTGSAQFQGCFFEDDDGRAEDERTGLSCPDRQAALAKQCLKRCADYASDTSHLMCAGSYPNTVWHISFGDISGDNGDSARVDLCGPRLRASVWSRLRQPPTR
jgi:hypothetical protein